jgi:hypothetical protein
MALHSVPHLKVAAAHDLSSMQVEHTSTFDW